VLLRWHPKMPQELPKEEEPICTVQLCIRGETPEFLEATLQQHHLARVVWTERHLERLMAVMARQRLGEPPHQDDLRLRRAPGRMVIDVHFRDKAAPLGCVVEILNAYSSGRSQRSEVVELLRAASRAQQVQQAALQESTENLEAMRRSLARLDSEWADAKAAAEKRHRGLLQRFALVLQAKIDKARSRELVGKRRLPYT
ncbi:unnamed protein product, partial [Effrenium voratum]